MADEKQAAEWDRTANLMALMANCHRDPKKTRPFYPEMFMPNPLRRKRKPRPARIEQFMGMANPNFKEWKGPQ